MYHFLSQNNLTGSNIISFHESKENDDDEKDFSCEQCGKRFSLKTHMSTHTGERPHVCDPSTYGEHYVGKQVLGEQHVKNVDSEMKVFVRRMFEWMNKIRWQKSRERGGNMIQSIIKLIK